MKSEIEISDMICRMTGLIDEEKIRNQVGNELAALSLLSNPKEFKELLLSFIRFPDGVEALRQKWRIVYNNSKAPLELMEIFAQDEEIRLQMLSDIRYLIDYGEIPDTTDLSLVLSRIEGGSAAISQNFEELFEMANRYVENIVVPMLQDEVGRKKFKDNFDAIKDKFLKGKNPSGFLKTIKALKGIEGFEDIYEDYRYLAQLYDEIEIPEIKKYPIDQILKLSPKEAEKMFNNIFAREIKEQEFIRLLNSEDRYEKSLILQQISNGNPYRYKANGTSSFVIQAGDQVVKLSVGKRKYEVPYHPRIMMPYFRKKYQDNTILEIFNYGDIDSVEITDQKLLEIYKELESAGILWGDARKTNLVVLTKDNELPDFIASKEFNLFGFLEDSRFPTNKHQVLKKGDIVICDLDMLYVKGDPEYQEGLLDDVIEKYLESKRKRRVQDGFEH